MSTRLPLILGILAASLASAQDHRIQVNARLGPQFVSVENANSSFINVTYVLAMALEPYVFIHPRFGIGLTYMSGPSTESMSEIVGGMDADGTYRHYGLSAMASTDRTRRFSFYGTVNIVRAEQALQFDWSQGPLFETGRVGTGLGAGFGTAVKINRWFSLNLFDLRALKYNSGFSYKEGGGAFSVQLQTGLIFKVMRIK